MSYRDFWNRAVRNYWLGMRVSVVPAGGGGRKPIEEHDPEVSGLLEQIMVESTAGDPMSPPKWSSKSSYQIRTGLGEQGHRISEDAIQRRLRKLDYSLQANIKDKERLPRPSATDSLATQRDGEALFGSGRAGDFSRRQKEGTGRRIQEYRAKMTEEGAGLEGTNSGFPESGGGDRDFLRRLFLATICATPEGL
jgi:hypothetical protein